MALVLDPVAIPHYSHSEHLPVFFYGGWASSFAPFSFRHPMLFEPSDWNDDQPPIYPTLWETREHWYQAHKDTDLRYVEAIAAMDDPWDTKRLGKSKVVNLREGWDDGLSYQTMLEGIRIQLDRYERLREDLRATGNRFIAEVSSQGDVIWGIHDPESGSWDGKNLLGAAWMQARSEL